MELNYQITTEARTVLCPIERCYNIESKEPGESIFVFRTYDNATPIALIRCDTLKDAWDNLVMMEGDLLADRLLTLDQWDENNILHKFICGNWYDLSRDHAWLMNIGEMQSGALLLGDPINPKDRIGLASCKNLDDGDFIYLLATEFGYCVAIGADNLETALDEAADADLMNRWKIDDPTAFDLEVNPSLGGNGDCFDLSYFAFTEIPRK